MRALADAPTVADAKLRPSPIGISEKYQSAYGNKPALLERRRQAGYESTTTHHSPLLTLVVAVGCPGTNTVIADVGNMSWGAGASRIRCLRTEGTYYFVSFKLALPDTRAWSFVTQVNWARTTGGSVVGGFDDATNWLEDIPIPDAITDVDELQEYLSPGSQLAEPVKVNPLAGGRTSAILGLGPPWHWTP
ncbi:hypothetical protein B0H13DRAFT_2312642 [Mycena leptocephala]|nr:hypothetical protein B0H13DRAFT_2312642 [Mycena leptocephala]